MAAATKTRAIMGPTWSTAHAAPLTAPESLSWNDVSLCENASPRSRPSAPRLSHAPSAWTGTTKTAVSPTTVAGARFMMANPPSRMSDTVIGARRGRPSDAGGLGADAAHGAGSGGALAVRCRIRGGPFHGLVLLAPPDGRRPSRHTGPVEGYEASTYGDRFADVYDDWYGDVTDAEACARRVAALVAERGGGAVLELGIGSGRLALPLAALGIEVHGIDASDAMLERLRAKPGGDALDPDGRATWPTSSSSIHRRSPSCSWPSTRSSTSARPTAQRRCLERVAGAARTRGAVRARGVRARVESHNAPTGASVAPRRITADEVVLSVSQHDADEQTVTGQHIHVTEAGIRLRPWHLRYAVSGRARRHGRGRRPPARVAPRRAGTVARSTADASVHVSAYDRGNVRAVRSPGSAAP